MRRYQAGIWALLWLALAMGCKPIHTTTYQSREKYATGPGPEDIVPDTIEGKPYLWVSTCARREGQKNYGAIHLFSPETGDLGPVDVINPPDSLKLHPHGIFLQTVEGIKSLYVITHDDEKAQHDIIQYRVTGKQLHYEMTYASPLLVSPNGMAVFPNGEMLVGNDSRKRGSLLEKILKKKASTIIHIAPDGTASVAADKIAYANGIAIRNKQVWIASTLGNHVLRYDFADGVLHNRTVVVKIPGPDNLRWHQGDLMTAGHPRSLKFIRHVKNAEYPTPTQIWRFDPDSGQKELLYGEDGAFIPAASTGVMLDGKLWISQVFESFLAAIEL